MDDPSPSPIPLSDETPVNKNTASPVLAFIIGLSIILLASVLNAAGLNLTKLDHVGSLTFPSSSDPHNIQVRTNAIPKAARRRDWLRPLWLLGMLLYMSASLMSICLRILFTDVSQTVTANR